MQDSRDFALDKRIQSTYHHTKHTKMELETPATDPEKLKCRYLKLTDLQGKTPLWYPIYCLNVAYSAIELQRSGRCKMTGTGTGPHTKSFAPHGLGLLCQSVDFIPKKFRKKFRIRIRMEYQRSRGWKMTGTVTGLHTKSFAAHGHLFLCDILQFVAHW